MWRSYIRCVKRNFTSQESWDVHLPKILRAIKLSEFVSIDLELTGLHSKYESFVGVDRCYEAHTEGAKSFMPMQIGICAARRNEQNRSHWILTPASMYIFPRNERFFKASTSTFSFLKDNNFDFNEWISGGLGYLRPSEENERRNYLRQRIEELHTIQNNRVNNAKNANIVTEKANLPDAFCASMLEKISSHDRRCMDEIRRKIDHWLKTSDNISSTLDFSIDNAFQRLLAHAMISSEYSGIYSHSVKKGKDRFLSLYRSEDKVYEEKLLSLEQELLKLRYSVGLRQILDEISEQRKPVVGHNCFYDFLHLYQTFYEDLPDKVAAFKTAWRGRFPMTLDTKYLSESHEQLSSLNSPNTLKGLCDFMATVVSGGNDNEDSACRISLEIEGLPDTTWSPPQSTKKMFLYCMDDTEKLKEINLQNASNFDHHSSVSGHEAGFDSLMTSIVFILQCSHILRSKKLSWNSIELGGADKIYGTMMEILSLMTNRIRLVKTQPNVINLNGNDDIDMSRHFLMSGYPSHWKKWELLMVWYPVPVMINVIDATSCWIIARSNEDAETILKLYNSSKKSQLFSFYKYEDLNSDDQHANLSLS